ncbi:GIY-YIG nuclease family protein [Neobacillus novalis]|uniref:GIY-YIG nuclease family protein n=1 Tax=Neobacillus novalis TaxID=220687 RepID=UPI0008242671
MKAGLYFFSNSNKLLYLGRSKDLYSTISQHINGNAQPTYKDNIFRLFTQFAIYEVTDYDPVIMENNKKLLVDLFKPVINIKYTNKPWRSADRILKL